MTVWLVCAYDWDGTHRVWGFEREENAWKFAEAQTDPRYEYSVEPLTLDSQEYI